jgi:sugar (pentulose or hexulose) kinase
VELDLLATGSSLGWLAGLLHLTPAGLEDLALTHPDPAGSAALALPYLAGGEQGALWRSDLTGTLAGLILATTAQDLAWALFEGIAFETVRCLNQLADGSRTVFTVSPPDSGHLRTAIVAATWPGPVAALAEASPSVLGAALVAFDALGVAVHPAPAPAVLPPDLGAAYLAAAAKRMTRYFEAAPVLSAPPLRP